MARRVAALALCAAGALAQSVHSYDELPFVPARRAQAFELCDAEYECEYRVPDASRAFYDIKPMCKTLTPYHWRDPNSDTEYFFNICGAAPTDCIPNYPVEHKRGVAVQFFGATPSPGAQCYDRENSKLTNCTRACEVLGVGPPIFSPYDTANPKAGVNVTHYGVPSLDEDPWKCDFDPSTGGTQERSVVFSILCDKVSHTPRIAYAREYSKCQYEVVIYSEYGCGCVPSCAQRNCGTDSCRGVCGGIGHGGQCPTTPQGAAQRCHNGACCKPDCRGRTCGDDGCGGTCGSCGPNSECSKYQVCAPINMLPTPSPSPLPPVYHSTTTGSDTTAAFLGGSFTAGVIALGLFFVLKAKMALAASADASAGSA